MGKENHLVYWGNSIISIIGMILAYEYYYYSSDFTPNPITKVTFKDGWNGVNKSSTVLFLISVLYYISLSFLLYRGSPWKKPIYRNILMTLLIVLNIVLIIVIFFTTEKHSWIDLVKIDKEKAAIVLAITLITNITLFFYNKVL